MGLKNNKILIKIGVVLICVLVFFSSEEQKGSPTVSQIIVKDITGHEDAQYRKDEKGTNWAKLLKKMEVAQNTIISTGKDTEVILDLGGGKGEFTIKQLSMVKVVDFEVKPIGNVTSIDSRVQVKIGKVNLKLKKTGQLQGQIKVDTPTETASITGTDCDFKVTPYGSSIAVNETAKRVELHIPTAGLTLNIVAREKVETTNKSATQMPQVKMPVQVVKEVSERKDVQLNITNEEKKFQISVNVSLDNIKPIQQSTQEHISKETIKNVVKDHVTELPPPVVKQVVENVIKDIIEELPPTIISQIEQIVSTTITTSSTSCPNHVCF